MTFQEWKDNINKGQGFTEYERQEFEKLQNFFDSEAQEKLKKSSTINFAQRIWDFFRNAGRAFSNDQSITDKEFDQIKDSFESVGKLFTGENNENRNLIMEILSGNPDSFITMLETLNSRMGLDIDVEQWKKDREYYQRRAVEQRNSDLSFLGSTLSGFGKNREEDPTAAVRIIFDAVKAAQNTINNNGDMSREDVNAVSAFKDAMSNKELREDILKTNLASGDTQPPFGVDGAGLMRLTRMLNNRCNAGIVEGQLQSEIDNWSRENAFSYVQPEVRKRPDVPVPQPVVNNVPAQNNIQDDLDFLFDLDQYVFFMKEDYFADKKLGNVIGDDISNAIAVAEKVIKNGAKIKKNDKRIIEKFNETLNNEKKLNEILDNNLKMDIDNPPLGRNGEGLIRLSQLLNSKCGAKIDINKFNKDVSEWYIQHPDAELQKEQNNNGVQSKEPQTEANNSDNGDVNSNDNASNVNAAENNAVNRGVNATIKPEVYAPGDAPNVFFEEIDSPENIEPQRPEPNTVAETEESKIDNNIAENAESAEINNADNKDFNTNDKPETNAVGEGQPETESVNANAEIANSTNEIIDSSETEPNTVTETEALNNNSAETTESAEINNADNKDVNTNDKPEIKAVDVQTSVNEINADAVNNTDEQKAEPVSESNEVAETVESKIDNNIVENAESAEINNADSIDVNTNDKAETNAVDVQTSVNEINADAVNNTDEQKVEPVSEPNKVNKTEANVVVNEDGVQVINGIPQYKKLPKDTKFLWENPAFEIGYYSQTYTTIAGEIPDKFIRARSRNLNEYNEPLSLGNISDDEENADDNFEEYNKNYAARSYGYDAKHKCTYGWAGSQFNVASNCAFNSEEGIKKGKEVMSDLKSACVDAANSTKDPWLKQYYNDRAFINDYQKGNFLQANLENPCISTLMTHIVNSGNFNTHSVKSYQKDQGESFFKEFMTVEHNAFNELKVEYLKQKYEKQGWNEDNEKNYLKQLDKAHTAALKGYDRIRTYDDVGAEDAPVKNNAPSVRRFQSTLGNNMRFNYHQGPNEHRGIISGIGYIRGEKIGIDHGWGAKELAIMGSLGAIDERVRSIGKFGSKEEKADLIDFKSDLVKLKCDVMNKYVVTSKDKKEVADKIVGFVEKYKDSKNKTIGSVMNFVNRSKGAFHQACGEVNEAVEMNKEYDELIEKKRRETPVEYMKELEDEARVTGNYKKFVHEYINIESRMPKTYNDEQAEYTMEEKEEWDEYQKSIVQCDNMKNIPKNPIFDDFLKEYVNVKMEHTVSYGDLIDQTAFDIRRGKLAVDKKYDLIKEDNNASRAIAINVVLDSPFLKKLDAIAGLTSDINNLHKNEDKLIDVQFKECEQAYKNNSYDGLSLTERNNKLAVGNGRINAKLSIDYGIADNAKDPENAVIGNKSKLYAMFKKSKNDNKKYSSEFDNVTRQAKEKYVRLEALAAAKKDNSIEFERMKYSLKKLSEMDHNSTPREMNDALEKVCKYSHQYEHKIVMQNGGFWKNGSKRKALSIELNNFAKESYRNLSNKITINVNDYEPLNEQLEHSKSLFEKQKKNYLLDFNTMLSDAQKKVNDAVKEKNKENFVNSMAELFVVAAWDNQIQTQVNKELEPKGKNAKAAAEEEDSRQDLYDGYLEKINKNTFNNDVITMKENELFKNMIKDKTMDEIAANVSGKDLKGVYSQLRIFNVERNIGSNGIFRNSVPNGINDLQNNNTNAKRTRNGNKKTVVMSNS